MQRLNFARASRNCMRIYALDGLLGSSRGNALNDRLESVSCKCQHAESVSSETAGDGQVVAVLLVGTARR